MTSIVVTKDTNKKKRKVMNIIQPASDKKKYKTVILKNGLRVLLISDPTPGSETKEIGVSLSVGVGSFSDPKDRQGLAHLLEHVILMGNKKYPIENSLDDYLEKTGGYSNAYTECEQTYYYMSVLPEYINEALDRFANIFIHPLLRPSTFRREINAVDSEFKAAIQSDTERSQQIFSKFCSGVYANFLWGDERSLKALASDDSSNSTEELLKKFYEKYYSSDIMNLVVIASENNINDIEKQVVELFSNIENKNLKNEILLLPGHRATSAAIITGNNISAEGVQLAYPKDKSAKVTIIESLRQQTNRLNLIFQLPSLKNKFLSMPSSYIASLLGHESEGSLLEELKRVGLATNISCGCSHDGFSRSSILFLFNVSVQLTEKGLFEYERVIKLIFEYINMLKRDGAQQWYCEENMHLSKLEFDFESEDDPCDFALSICERMSSNRFVSTEDFLRANRVIARINLDEINELFQYFVPENMFTELITSKFKELHLKLSKNFQSLQKEEEYYFKSQYFQIPMAPHLIEFCNDLSNCNNENLFMPRKNPFIPESLKLNISPMDLLSNESKSKVLERLNLSNNAILCNNIRQSRKYQIPELLIGRDKYLKTEQSHNALSSDFLNLWYLPDQKFFQPKTNVTTFFWCPNALKAFGNIFSAICLDIFVNIVTLSLTTYGYMAELAELEFSLKCKSGGMELRMAGFDDKMLDLAKIIMSEIVNEQTCKTSEESQTKHRKVYDMVIELLEQKYLNATIEPQRQANALRLSLILNYRIHPKEAKIALKKIQYSDYKRYVKSMFDTIAVDMFVHGNMLKKNAIELSNVITSICLKEKMAPLSSSTRPSFRVLKFKEELILKEKSVNKNEKNVACEMYFQIDCCKHSYDQHIINLRILDSLMSEKFFDILRTKEQLGYYVSCDWLKSCNVAGYHFTIKSPSFSADHIEERIERFISRFALYLRQISNKVYDKNCASIAKARLLPPDNLSSETNRLWNQIIDEKFKWNSRQMEANAILQTSKESLSEWFENYFIKNRRKAYFVVEGYKKETGKMNVDDEEEEQDCDGNDDDDSDSKMEGEEEDVEEKEDVFPDSGIHDNSNCDWWVCKDRVHVTNVREYALTCGLYPSP
jgi:secreted Zn-dependent insulinase-like peptidase